MKTVDRSFITARKRNSAPSIPPAVNSTASSVSLNPDPRPPTDSPDEPHFSIIDERSGKYRFRRREYEP